MGPVEPPQHEGHLLQYAGGKLVELQQKFDILCGQDGKWQLMISNSVFRMLDATASQNFSIDSVLLQIAQCKHLIATN